MFFPSFINNNVQKNQTTGDTINRLEKKIRTLKVKQVTRNREWKTRKKKIRKKKKNKRQKSYKKVNEKKDWENNLNGNFSI